MPAELLNNPQVGHRVASQGPGTKHALTRQRQRDQQLVGQVHPHEFPRLEAERLHAYTLDPQPSLSEIIEYWA